MLQAFHLCDTYISPLSEGVYFDSLTDIVGVLSGNQEANRNILIQLYEQLRKQFSATIYIILGEMVSHFLQVKNSYESAKFFRLAGMFTKEEVFISKKELSPKLLLKDPAFRDLQLQLEDKNINKSFESALKISTATLNQENKQKMLENRLVIALFFLKTYESILTSDEVENVILLMNSFYKDETPQWLSSYMNLFRKYHNKQINALHPYVLRIINLVEDNYEDPDLNLSTLAEKLKVTSVYLGQLFYLQTEQHFNDYLTDIRLKKVCHLLITTSIKIGNIAKQVGFSSQSYLNRVFRKNIT